MKICCIGDSLTEGDYGIFGKRGIGNVQPENYPFFLAELTGAEVKNYGKCGYTATSALNYYRSGAVDVRDADIILIMLGTNGGLDPDRETDGNQSYRALIAACRADAPLAAIYLCTPPHATENPMFSNCGYGERVRMAVAFTRKLAEEESLPLIEVDSCPDFTAENEHIMQPNDGLHFGKTGYQTLARFIYEELRRKNVQFDK